MSNIYEGCIEVETRFDFLRHLLLKRIAARLPESVNPDLDANGLCFWGNGAMALLECEYALHQSGPLFSLRRPH